MEDSTLRPKGKPPRGRGAPANPKGRFETLEVSYDPAYDLAPEEEPGQIRTQYYKETTRSVVSFNDSPDVGMSATINPYRGCEHGCIYCYARPTHEYFGMSAGIDFETKLFVKTDAAEKLRATLSKPSWQPQVIALSGVTDPYQPSERKLKITRQCLEVLAECVNPVVIITKNQLVTRDIDLLKRLAEHQAVEVNLSITSLDRKIARTMEPRASRPDLRLKAIRELSSAGIPAGVMVAPIIPGLTDHEVPAILEAAKDAGATRAGHTVVRLPYGVKHLFEQWLEEHHPLKKEKVLSRIREVRGGKLNDAEFGSRMRGKGQYADIINELFYSTRKRLGLDRPTPPLNTSAFRRPALNQLSLF
jgi:DNA repair photolyase